jgi:hypothetical protein
MGNNHISSIQSRSSQQKNYFINFALVSTNNKYNCIFFEVSHIKIEDE